MFTSYIRIKKKCKLGDFNCDMVVGAGGVGWSVLETADLWGLIPKQCLKLTQKCWGEVGGKPPDWFDPMDMDTMCITRKHFIHSFMYSKHAFGCQAGKAGVCVSQDAQWRYAQDWTALCRLTLWVHASHLVLSHRHSSARHTAASSNEWIS